MIKRHGDADAILLAVAEALADEEAVVDEVVVRQRRALGEAGRAGGVLDVDRVVELELGRARLERGSNAASGSTMQAPWVVQARLPSTMPKQW